MEKAMSGCLHNDAAVILGRRCRGPSAAALNPGRAAPAPAILSTPAGFKEQRLHGEEERCWHAACASEQERTTSKAGLDPSLAQASKSVWLLPAQPASPSL